MTPMNWPKASICPSAPSRWSTTGGRGSRLKNLTDRRAKPAVYFGGKFRIIDFALSNCLNSGIRRIGVITQYKSHSLMRHLQRGWAFLKSEMNEFVDLMPAQQRLDEEKWYRGTADAVYQNQDILASYRADYIVVLAGDHIYKMNYALMLADHVSKGRECTVGCIAVPRMEATGFGVMAMDDKYNITAFIEKPADPPAMPGRPDHALASMGIYIFNARFLYKELERDIADPNSSHDFGRDIIPHVVTLGQAAAHPFDLSAVGTRHNEEPYWRDVGTIDAYWDANIDLTTTDAAQHDALADLDLSAAVAPAKFMHNKTSAAWPWNRWSRAAASSRARCSARCCIRAFACIRIRASAGRCCCPTCRWAVAPASTAWSSTAAAKSPTAW
jgi:glucose-1-phosphate adenylyltransferase